PGGVAAKGGHHGIPSRVRAQRSGRNSGDRGQGPRERRGARRGPAGGRRASRPGLETGRRQDDPRPVPRRQWIAARRSARRSAAVRVDARHRYPARAPSQRSGNGMSARLPDPRLTHVYRLEATLAQPLDLGATARGHRRIVPLTGGTFTGPELNGTLLPGASADWQIVLPDGTALGDIRYTLQTDGGDLLYVKSRGLRHGSADVLARLGHGEEVEAGEYTFRTSTEIETAAPQLDWLNKGIFIGVAGR